VSGCSEQDNGDQTVINIEKIRSAIDATLAKAEAAEVQANLGRMELEQRFKAQYEDLVRSASELQQKLENAGITEEAIRTRLKGALEELRLQAALGEADTREALARLRSEIEKRIAEFNAALDSVATEAEDDAKGVEQAVGRYVKHAASVEAELAARSDHKEH
jgi:ABC-type phosphate transport system auxiliary subunit